MFVLILGFSFVSSFVTPPNCKYAAKSAHYYPIDVCVVDKHNVTTDEVIAYKYECNGENTVNQVYYNTTNCTDMPYLIQNVTDSIDSFNCNNNELNCSYAVVNRYSKCGFDPSEPDNTTCDQCAMNPDNFNLRRLPWITGHCYGVEYFYFYSTCINGTYTDYASHEQDCLFDLRPDQFYVVEQVSNNECINDEYITVECVMGSPTMEPTKVPSSSPTNATISPTMMPSKTPTKVPSTSPTTSTEVPSNSPTTPTMMPTVEPTLGPTQTPTQSPTIPILMDKQIVVNATYTFIGIIDDNGKNISDIIAIIQEYIKTLQEIYEFYNDNNNRRMLQYRRRMAQVNVTVKYDITLNISINEGFENITSNQTILDNVIGYYLENNDPFRDEIESDIGQQINEQLNVTVIQLEFIYINISESEIIGISMPEETKPQPVPLIVFISIVIIIVMIFILYRCYCVNNDDNNDNDKNNNINPNDTEPEPIKQSANNDDTKEEEQQQLTNELELANVKKDDAGNNDTTNNDTY